MRIQLNRAFRGMQGVLDDVVYKRFEGRTIAVPKPDPFTGPPTAAQVAQRERWKEAASYARAVFADPVRKTVYVDAARAAGRQTVFAITLGDYMSAPKVTDIDLSAYAGAAGNVIKINAVDDFEVVAVSVTIRDAQGNVVEDGPAIRGDTRWIYTAQTPAPAGPLTIEAQAFDRPGNPGVLTKPWSP
jgi:hypothetical protein